jgi:hypothetical protein
VPDPKDLTMLELLPEFLPTAPRRLVSLNGKRLQRLP